MIDAVLLVWIWRSLRLLVEKLKEQNTMHPHARLTSCMERGEGRYVIVQAHKCLCCCCCSVTQSCPNSAIPWTVGNLASLSFTISQSLLKLISIKSMLSSNQLILCCPLLLLPSIFPNIRVFSSLKTPLVRGIASVPKLALLRTPEIRPPEAWCHAHCPQPWCTWP